MIIKLYKKGTKSLNEFNKREWISADLEHYGEGAEWKEGKYKIAALDEKRIVGYLNMEFKAGVVRIKNIIVTKEKRGLGIGKQLMQKVEQLAKKNGLHKIYLETGKNWQSVEFYKSVGYQITGELRNHHHHHDFVIFTKFI